MRLDKKFWATVFTLTGTVIGAGILGLPYVFAKSGFFVGLFWLIFLGIITIYFNLALGEVTLRTKGVHHLPGLAEKYLGNCTANGLSCPWILIDEFNVGSDIEKNTSSYAEKYEMDVANGFIGILNAYPSIVSLVLYQWTELYSYSNTSYYPEWPKKYAIINALDNETSPAYYATANFTRLCPAGSNVLNTTSDDGLIRTVACKNINHYSYIIANAGLDSRNLTLNLTNYPYNNITNIMTDEIYLKDSNNQTNVGIIDSYDVIYLSSEDDSTAPHISFSCDHSIVSFGDTLRCNCNATDSISGITSMSYDSAPLTSQLGTFSASCNATNGAGVTVSSVLSYQVIEGGLGTGGGSSSGRTGCKKWKLNK